MLARLLQVVSEPLRKLLVSCLLLELGERLDKRLLCVKDIAELVQEQLAWIIHLDGAHQISLRSK